ncbi:YrrS family protein [Bacillus sp. FJAT-22090]|uniref:YrrS family protein n=1 Tax=Bacillus sp. FJAT-22090 TaxID=1581038 RepID=UPI0011A4E325|nr:YrrS family protein [Bacillus sp. FJAT-22090]
MPENNRRMNMRQTRKKKTNTILNVLIGIVLLLIIVVVVKIVTGDEPKESAVEQTVSDTAEKQDDTVEEVGEIEKEDSNESTNQNETNTSSSTENENQNTNSVEENDESDSGTTEQSNDSNIGTVEEDSEWEPIGTTQTGEHVSSYDSSSVDWAEKVKALSYASGLDPNNMYVKFLGNGGSPQKSIGTVTSKDGKEIYRISLEWIDGQGWKPTKKEKLASLEDAS